MVRASHLSSEGCGSDPRNRFSEDRAWRTFIYHLSPFIGRWSVPKLCKYLSHQTYVLSLMVLLMNSLTKFWTPAIHTRGISSMSGGSNKRWTPWYEYLPCRPHPPLIDVFIILYMMPMVTECSDRTIKEHLWSYQNQLKSKETKRVHSEALEQFNILQLLSRFS